MVSFECSLTAAQNPKTLFGTVSLTFDWRKYFIAKECACCVGETPHCKHTLPETLSLRSGKHDELRFTTHMSQRKGTSSQILCRIFSTVERVTQAQNLSDHRPLNLAWISQTFHHGALLDHEVHREIFVHMF